MTSERHGDETVVFGNGPRIGDEIWWQAGRIMFVRKVAYSLTAPVSQTS